MSPSAFKFPRFGSSVLGGALDKLVERISNAFDGLSEAVTNDAIVRTPLDTVPRRVFHGLGESPRAWEVVGIDAAAMVYEPQASDNRALYVWLAASAPVNVQVRFS